MHIVERIRRALIGRLLPIPVTARHVEYSVIASLDDDPAHPSQRLLDVALKAVHHARTVSLADVAARVAGPIPVPEVWPGEGYKLLAGLIAVLAPKLIVEIGTGGGTGTLTMLRMLAPAARLVTFDPVRWDDYPEHLLRGEDFQDGRLTQHADDLANPECFARHRGLLERTEVFFLDGPKDGLMEQRFLDHLRTVAFAAPPVLIFDDIRVRNMLRIWRRIASSKLDLTSFGHWTGTGLVEWQPAGTTVLRDR